MGQIIDIKQTIQEFLKNNLDLELSLEKTKITDLRRDSAKFLAYRIGYYLQTRKTTRITGKIDIKLKTDKKHIIGKVYKPLFVRKHVKRTTGQRLIMGIDKEKVINRLVAKGFWRKRRGINKSAWATFEPQEIIQRYNYMIRGLTLYYAPIVKDFSQLNELIYILNYSCYHTLACKYNTSIRKIIKKYGKPVKFEIVTKLKKVKSLRALHY